MAYVDKADFRANSLKWFTRNLMLTEAQAADDDLVAAIAWASQLLDDECDDHFEPLAAEDAEVTIELNGGDISTIRLPYRAREITKVETLNDSDVYVEEDVAAYKFVSSLDSAGINPMSTWDYIHVPDGKVLSSGSSRWPDGDGRVRVTGKFGWATTPLDIQLAVAQLVFDRMMPANDALRLAQKWSTKDADFARSTTEPTGLPEVDRVIQKYRRY